MLLADKSECYVRDGGNGVFYAKTNDFTDFLVRCFMLCVADRHIVGWVRTHWSVRNLVLGFSS